MSSPEEIALLDRSNQVNEANLEVVLWLRDKTGFRVDLGEHDTGIDATAEDLFNAIYENLEAEDNRTYTKNLLRKVFSMWMVSPLLTLPMKDFHKPYPLAQYWDDLCKKYVDCTEEEIARDEPVVMLQRNLFLTKSDEDMVVSERMWELLYSEAKSNVVNGNYYLTEEDYDILAGIQAVVEKDRFNGTGQSELFKKAVKDFYPKHMCKAKGVLLKPGKKQQETNMGTKLEIAYQNCQYRDANKLNLYKSYVKICRNYPFYGAAFFEADVLKPKGMIGNVGNYLFGQAMTHIMLTVNMEGISIIDDEVTKVAILSLSYDKFSYNLMKNEDEPGGDREMLRFLIEFIPEGQSSSSVLQVFSYQARLIEASIKACSVRVKNLQSAKATDETDSFGAACVNQLERLCLTQVD